MATAVYRGKKITEVDPSEVDFEFPDADFVTGANSSLIPLPSNVPPARLFYGARFIDQALPAANKELPWVQRAIQGTDKSFDDHYGSRSGAIFADEDGEVVNVKEDEIHLKTKAGLKKVPVVKWLPFNRKSALIQTPAVRAGDLVKKGQALVDSNYTKNGSLALGVNARIGLLAYNGESMDDAGVISESFAKRMASNTCYGYSQDFDQNIKGGKGHVSSLFPSKYTLDQLEKLDDDGVAKVGTILQKGDPYILATKPRSISSRANFAGLSRNKLDVRNDASQIWEHDYDGVVVGAANHKGTANVYISAQVPLHQADKLSLRAGQKLTVSKILPDDQMPRGEDGEPMDLMLNHLGLPSRVNAATLYTMLLGKAAAKTGKPVKIPGFLPKGQTMQDYVNKALADAGLPEREKIFDPMLGRYLEGDVVAGNEYVLRLHHIAEAKSSNRGTGSYDSNDQPSRGSGDTQQAKRFSELEGNAALAAGAYNLQMENSTIRGSKSDDFWRAMRSGKVLPKVGTPYVWDKYKALLNGSGFRVHEESDGIQRLGPLSDKDLDKLGPDEIQSDATVDFASMTPIKGGLFDPVMAERRQWGKISLPEPVVNPAFEGAVRALLGLSEKDFREVYAGRKRLQS
jgi:DNA-directed RNA polymerase subunit beta